MNSRTGTRSDADFDADTMQMSDAEFCIGFCHLHCNLHQTKG